MDPTAHQLNLVYVKGLIAQTKALQEALLAALPELSDDQRARLNQVFTDTTPALPVAPKTKTPRKPRLPSPYNLYVAEQLPILRAENKEMNNKDLMKLVASKWNAQNAGKKEAAAAAAPAAKSDAAPVKAEKPAKAAKAPKA